MTIFEDTFTDSDSTDLASHTPTVGDSWTQLWQTSAGPVFQINSNQCNPTAANNAGVLYTADATYSSADYYIEFTLVGTASLDNHVFFAILRLTDVDNMYALAMRPGDNWRILKKVSGSWSLADSEDGPAAVPADGSTIKFEANGTSLKVYDDGVEILSAVDSDISAAGKAGLASGGGAELVGGGDDSRNSNIIDDLVIDVVAGGATVSRNTDSNPLGIHTGMGWRVNTP